MTAEEIYKAWRLLMPHEKGQFLSMVAMNDHDLLCEALILRGKCMKGALQ